MLPYTMYAVQRIFISNTKHLKKLQLSKRYCSTALVPVSELVEKRNYLFSLEQKKQLEEVGRIEKITVEVCGPPEDVTLAVNQNISTPYDCCKHISQGLCEQTPLALVNNETLWDMHRPLPANCTLKFLNFKDQDPYLLNKVFWRTGSFLLGAVISKAFTDESGVLLHSFPPPHVKSGSFVYDCKMDKILAWEPTVDELKVLSAEFLTLVHKNLKIERLQVKKSVALEMFEGNPEKQKQIPDIVHDADSPLITLYRVGDHIDISCGPMVANTSFFGRCSVTAVHRITNEDDQFYRFQGVALPKGIMLNGFTYEILCRRATRLNEAIEPGLKNKRFAYYGSFPVSSPPSKSDVKADPCSYEL